MSGKRYSKKHNRISKRTKVINTPGMVLRGGRRL